jgi:hypothetical protein
MIEFKYIDDGDEVIVRTDAVTITDVMQQFENFLRATGFTFTGSIDILEDGI